MIRMNETDKVDNLEKLLADKFYLSSEEINRRIDKQLKLMGDAIH